MDHQVQSSKPKLSSKLCPRHTTVFKKSSPTVKGLAMRQETMIKKAFELSTLCDSELCVFQYDLNGKLINTWPEDQTKVHDVALRYQLLPDTERIKKSTNLFQFLNKKMLDERNHSLKNNDKKFSLKVEEMKASLRARYPELQEKILRLQVQEEAQRYQSSSLVIGN